VSANAQTFVPFHSGVNLSAAPGGADRSRLPLATQQAENAQRVAVAAEIRTQAAEGLGKAEIARRAGRLGAVRLPMLAG
jgi:hypothetical protein